MTALSSWQTRSAKENLETLEKKNKDGSEMERRKWKKEKDKSEIDRNNKKHRMNDDSPRPRGTICVLKCHPGKFRLACFPFLTVPLEVQAEI